MVSRLKPRSRQPFARSDVEKVFRRARDNARNKAKREAKAKRDSLTDDEVKEQIQLTQGEVEALNRIAAGYPMRNAGEVIRAIKLKMEFSVKKPVQEVASDQKITVEVHTLADEPEPKEEIPPPPAVEVPHEDP